MPETSLGAALCATEVGAEPSVALLPDGKVVLTVAGETRVVVLDSLCSVVDSMGRSGEGPGEYRFAARAFVDSVGGFHVLDPVLQRISHYNASAEHLGATPVTGGPAVSSLVLAGDGAVFFTEPLPSVDDSVALVVHRAVGESDGVTLTRLHRPAPVLVPLGAMAINTPPEYAAFDAWGALPGGVAWVARGADNRLELVRRAGSTTGPAVPFARVETVPADRERWRGLPAPQHFRVSTRPLAPLKAPFQGVIRAADGEFWMWLNQAAGHTVERYACRTLESAELLRITIPNAHKVLALGAQHVYIYGEDADGTPMFSMHPRPRCAP